MPPARPSRGHDGVYGVLGHRIEHSQSPALFRRVFDALGWEAVYARFDLPPHRLAPFLRACADTGVAGFSITAPYKTCAMPHLDQVDRVAATIGAVNAVAVRRGVLLGFNTDVVGVHASLRPCGRVLHGKEAVIFGAGGAARAVVWVLAHKFGMARITVVARSTRRARRWFPARADRRSSAAVDISPWRREEIRRALGTAALVINATPLGSGRLAGRSPLPRGVRIPARCIVFDLAYRPRPSVLLKQARQDGCRFCFDGWTMLVAQAEASFRIWTGRSFPPAVRRTLLIEGLGND